MVPLLINILSCLEATDLSLTLGLLNSEERGFGLHVWVVNFLRSRREAARDGKLKKWYREYG